MRTHRACTMPPDPVCPRCCEPLPSGEFDCPYCAGRRRVPLHHREPLVIAAVVVVAIGLWVGTTFVTSAYAARQQQLARQWFQRGEADSRAGPPPTTLLGDDLTVEEAHRRAEHASSDVLLVRRSPSGWSILRRDELKKMASLGKGDMSLQSVLPQQRAPILHPDHPLDSALHYIYDWPLLPVVHRADLLCLVGVLTMADILRAYRGAETEPVQAPQAP